ncbi:chemotaxis protein CheA [Haloterrigena salifodinae]|uniref:chemotaxis protein CheA n=1 Tax=Haloterrigena salifodinae TaxID=2675099 RepID=UPI000F890974|nr:chemotaxis protein CheA [Haloterrigena salifodinae]
MVRVSDAITTFVHESEEDIQKLNNALLDLENDPDGNEAIETVFRVAHNLKGNFGIMGFATASELSHAVEDLLDQIRDGRLEVTSERMDLVFEAVDQIELMVDEIAENGEPTTDPAETIESIRASIDGESAQAATEQPAANSATAVDDAADDDGRSRYRATVDVGETDAKRVDAMFVLDATGDADAFELVHTVPDRDTIEDGEFDGTFDVELAVDAADDGDEIASFYEESRYVESVTVDSVADATETETADETPAQTVDSGVETAPDTSSEDGDDDSDESNSEETSIASRRNKEVESIRVDVEQVDRLYNQVEEMVTSRIKLRKIIKGSGLVSAEEELEEHGKITSSLQDTVLEIRLVPLEKIVGNFPRVVRDLARDQGKEIDFEMEGVDNEMDRSILNELSDPLMHIIRNAVDHGIEPPAVREEKGKPREGTIRLTGERERDRVSITVEDDGAGLDVERIKEKAVEKGIMTQEEIDVLDESEVYDLIFHPGFSTRDEVTEVSGRGVGMDVVNEVVRGVDGTINVESEPDEGTSVTLTLPVSVAIVRVLFVTIGDETYGIPIKNIDEISELEDLTIETIEGQEIITHDDRVYPLIALDDTLDVGDAERSDDDMVIRIKTDVRQVCIRCSDVVGQEEVVIKPFEGILSGAPGISGASVLGEGEVVMILDVETL